MPINTVSKVYTSSQGNLIDTYNQELQNNNQPTLTIGGICLTISLYWTLFYLNELTSRKTRQNYVHKQPQELLANIVEPVRVTINNITRTNPTLVNIFSKHAAYSNSAKQLQQDYQRAKQSVRQAKYDVRQSQTAVQQAKQQVGGPANRTTIRNAQQDLRQKKQALQQALQQKNQLAAQQTPQKIMQLLFEAVKPSSLRKYTCILPKKDFLNASSLTLKKEVLDALNSRHFSSTGKAFILIFDYTVYGIFPKETHSHAMGLIHEENGIYYLYDPNAGIYQSASQQELILYTKVQLTEAAPETIKLSIFEIT